MAAALQLTADKFNLLQPSNTDVFVSAGLLRWKVPAAEEISTGLVPQQSTRAFKQGTPAQFWSESKQSEAKKRIEASGAAIPASETAKLQSSAAVNWDSFYRANTINFFKDRHYLERDFPCLRQGAHRPTLLLELGCGVGNAFFPLLPRLPQLSVIACDMSGVAIDFVRQHPKYDGKRVKAFVADPTCLDFHSSTLVDALPEQGADVVLMLFMLSAMDACVHRAAFEAAAKYLRPGGFLCFRDYGFMDEAMLRFKTGHKAGDQLYVRGDQTLSYFFKAEELQQHAEAVGLHTTSCVFLNRVYENREQNKEMGRIFVHGVFKKPL